MLVTLCEMGEVYFRLLSTNGFHVKAESEIFTAGGWRCRQNLKYENFASSFGRLREKIAPKSVPHVCSTIISLIQPIISLICGVVVALPLPFLKLPFKHAFGRL